MMRGPDDAFETAGWIFLAVLIVAAWHEIQRRKAEKKARQA